jgi:hypothetical protein
MLDAFLDWVTVFLPTLLSIGSVIVSMKTPHSKHHRWWYGGLILAGVGISGLTFLQQSRSRSAHANEVGSLNTRLGTLGINLKTVQGTVDTLTQQQQTEVARRQQAERDLAIIVQATGKSTREGVVGDIKKSPIQVQLNGAPVPPAIPIQIPNIKLIWEAQASLHDDAKFCQKLIFQSDISVNPVALVTTFSASVRYADLVIKTATLGGVTINKDNNKRVDIALRGLGGDALLRSDESLVVVVCSTEDFKPLTVQKANLR